MKSNTPNMNITNQINAGLNDVRATLIDFSCFPNDGTDQKWCIEKAKYQMDLIFEMIHEHKEGNSVPWSDRKYLVEEEFDQ